MSWPDCLANKHTDMLFWGNQITKQADPLQAIEVASLHQKTASPKPAYIDKIQQLRALQSIDTKLYSDAKRQLPYFVFSTFHPSVRRKENFSSTSCLLLDLDHLTAAQLTVADLRAKIQADERVHWCFLSPGGDGLKILFLLDTPCRDAGQYSALYKIFARQFAEQYQLLSVIDMSTHDVSRACFISWDPDSYFNPLPCLLNWRAILPMDDADAGLFQAKRAADTVRQEQPAAAPPVQEPGGDILVKIRAALGPERPRPPKREAFVPEEINQLLPDLREHLLERHIELVEARPIQYGRQLQMRAGIHTAELNLFFGKRGFSLVKTTKTGTHPELVDLCHRIIQDWLYQNNFDS